MSNLDLLNSISLPIKIGATEITHCELITVPSSRFIGKRYDGYPNWGDAWENGWFDAIEAAGEQSPVNDGSYCVLYGRDGTHWLGEFMKPGTPAPEGLDVVDLPERKAVMFFIKGQQGDCYTTAYDTEAMYNIITDMEIPRPDESREFRAFERDNCPRWTDPDEDGNLTLDWAIML
jgi:hypothetical protein